MSQLARMVTASGAPRKRRWPYHARVMKVLDRISNRIVRIETAPGKTRGPGVIPGPLLAPCQRPPRLLLGRRVHDDLGGRPESGGQRLPQPVAKDLLDFILDVLELHV